jgi:hypothetical protein
MSEYSQTLNDLSIFIDAGVLHDYWNSFKVLISIKVDEEMQSSNGLNLGGEIDPEIKAEAKGLIVG